MCGRYYIQESPLLEPVLEAMNRSPLMPRFRERGDAAGAGEIRPAQVAPVIALSRSGRQTVFPMRWGFGGKRLLINARTETAAERPAFREAWASHRCVIPASWYYEWEHIAGPDGRKKTGPQYTLRPAGEEIAWLCGLYRMEAGLPCYVILTREPGESIRFIHDRMPLMLPEGLIGEWIRPGGRPEALLPYARTDIQYEKTARPGGEGR